MGQTRLILSTFPILISRAALERYLGAGDLTVADMGILTEIKLSSGRDIRNLTGLEYATNLTSLEFVGSNINLGYITSIRINESDKSDS